MSVSSMLETGQVTVDNQNLLSIYRNTLHRSYRDDSDDGRDLQTYKEINSAVNVGSDDSDYQPTRLPMCIKPTNLTAFYSPKVMVRATQVTVTFPRMLHNFSSAAT